MVRIKETHREMWFSAGFLYVNDSLFCSLVYRAFKVITFEIPR